VNSKIHRHPGWTARKTVLGIFSTVCLSSFSIYQHRVEKMREVAREKHQACPEMGSFG